MRWKTLFSKPVTVKKCLVYVLLVALATGIGFAGRMAYVMLNPNAAFRTPPLTDVVEADKPDFLPTPTPVVLETPVGEEPDAEGEAEPVGTPIPTPNPEDLLLSQADLAFLKDRVNILLVGVDENEDRDQSRREDFRSDVLILLTLDLQGKTADLISIPRDTYTAQYNKKGRWKINACFAHGGGFEKDGFLYARETVSMLFGGLPIPYHIGIQMDGVKKAVDVIGGVDYDVDVEIRLNGRVLEKGPQHLNGQQVLDYCRARKGISTDVGRADRQQRILFAIFNQLKTQGRLTQVPELFLAMKDYLFTNLNVEQVAALAVLGLQLDPEHDLNRHTLAGEYLSDVYNFSFYALYQQKKCDLVKEIFGITIKPDRKYDVSFIRSDWARIVRAREEKEAAQNAAQNALQQPALPIPNQMN